MSTINTILEDIKEHDQSSIAMSNLNPKYEKKQVRLNKGTNSTRDIHMQSGTNQKVSMENYAIEPINK